MSVSLDFLEILGRRKKNKISQGGVWADLTPPFVTLTEIAECLVSVSTARISSPVQSKPSPEYP